MAIFTAKPPNKSQMKVVVARAIGFSPAETTFIKLVLIPRAVMAIVKSALSKNLILSTISGFTRLNELKIPTVKKANANQGITSLDDLFLQDKPTKISNTGNIKTLVILTITALFEAPSTALVAIIT